MPNYKEGYSGANWTEGQMHPGHTNPGAVKHSPSWWEEGAAAVLGEAAPKLFDFIVNPTKIGTHGGTITKTSPEGEVINNNAAPPDHYDRFIKAKNRAANQMTEQSNLLETTQERFLQNTRDSLKSVPDSVYSSFSDEELNKYIKDNPERFYSWSTGDENKNHYMNKYNVNQFANPKGMSLNDFIAERNKLDERIKKSSDAFNIWKEQPNLGKDIYKSKLPEWTPDWLMPSLPENSMYARQMNALNKESPFFDETDQNDPDQSFFDKVKFW